MKIKSEVGNRFYYLVVLTHFTVPSTNYSKSKVTAKCICGKVKEYWLSHLKTGKIKSCGCYSTRVKRRKHLTMVRHTKRNRWIKHNGERLLIADWSRVLNIPYGWLRKKIVVGKLSLQECIDARLIMERRRSC